MWFFISDCLAWLEPGDLYKIELGVTVSRAGFYVDLTQAFRNIDMLVQNNLRYKQNQVFLFLVMSESNLKLFCYSSCPLLLHLLPKEMQDTLSIGRVLLSPCRLLSALLVSESSNGDVTSKNIKYLEDAVSVLACKGQLFQYQLVFLYTHHTDDIMERCQTSSTQMHCGTKYALKLSVETRVKGGAVNLYNMMCQQERAVEPVRTLDTEPAASYADDDQTGGPFGEVRTKKSWVKCTIKVRILNFA